MRIEKLSLNKIKVTVGYEDLSLYDISYETLSPTSPRLRAFILAMMKRAEIEIGFSAPAGNVMIEAIPQGDEFVFLITRVDAQTEEKAKPVLTREEKREKLKNRSYRIVKKHVTQDKPDKQIFRFENLQSFALLLKVASLPKTAVLYKCEDSYYLSLPCGSAKAKQLANIVLEFAASVDEKLIQIYLKEHAKVFARGNEFDKILACYK